MSISTHNIRIYLLSETFRSLYFLVPIYLIYLQKHLSISQISFLIGFQFFVQLILELPTGAIADLLGKRITIVLSYIFDTFFFLGYLYAHSFLDFLVIYAASGIGEALRSGSSEAIVFDSLKQDHREDEFPAIGARQGLYFQIGLVAATIIGGFVYQLTHTLPILLVASAQALAGLSAFFYREPYIDTVKFSLSSYFRQIKLGINEAFKTTTHRLMSTYYIAVGSISWLVMTYYVDYLLIDLGFDAPTRGIISAGARIFNIILINRFLIHLPRRNTVIFFPILLILSLTPGIWLQGWWSIPFITGAMMSSTARWILLGKYTNHIFDSRYRATALSTLSMAIGLVYIVFTTISGPIMTYYGGSRTIFTILGIASMFLVIPLAYQLVHTDSALIHNKNMS